MKLAIIGASTGQISLTLKAKELGHTVISFAWGEGAVCKDITDKFYPISIFETEKIIEICKQEGVEGVVSNASDLTAEISAEIATALGLNTTNVEAIRLIKNKFAVRERTNDIPGLSKVKSFCYTGAEEIPVPCVIKPATGAGKVGVTFVGQPSDLPFAMDYIKQVPGHTIQVEEFIGGVEFSVESISYKGEHYVLQITDKENDGAPHFAELGSHQPSFLPEDVKERIRKVVPIILSRIGYTDGASHIEMKYYNDNLYLIEVNPRGGGGQISDLVPLSTGYDYFKGMIDVALGIFEMKELPRTIKYAGVFYLCEQRINRLKYFQEKQPWEVQKYYNPSAPIAHTHTSYDLSGWITYCSDKRIEID